MQRKANKKDSSVTQSNVQHPTVSGFQQEKMGTKFRKRIRLILGGEDVDIEEAATDAEPEVEDLTQPEQQALENDDCRD